MTLDVLRERPLLIYGIGNVGRGDDGLGPQLVERLEAAGVPDGVSLECGYQLVPEDALLLSRQAGVLFVDATVEPGAEPYVIADVFPSDEPSISTHLISMASLLALCVRLSGRAPRAAALAIAGFEFDVNASLSARAGAHLERALRDLRTILGETQ